MPLCAAWAGITSSITALDNPVQIRTCPYLNNIVEQDHRRVKSRVGPMLGFKHFFNARRVVAGVELVQKILPQLRTLYFDRPLAATQNSLTWSTDFLQLFFVRRRSTQIFNDIFIRSHLSLADERSAFLNHKARCCQVPDQLGM
jgi:hypothetical protein